jgi:hypothetical protein
MNLNFCSFSSLSQWSMLIFEVVCPDECIYQLYECLIAKDPDGGDARSLELFPHLSVPKQGSRGIELDSNFFSVFLGPWTQSLGPSGTIDTG